jgi:hypothetical protein
VTRGMEYMDKGFKWNMFITSFIPLWVSIIVADIWSVIENGISNWTCEKGIAFNLINVCQDNLVSLLMVLIITILLMISTRSINKFLKDKCSNNAPPKIKIIKAIRANKLSSEFLLAYILPMIAFDFTEIKSIVLFTIYFVMLAFLCIRNSNVYTNIWLEIKGYKMFLCDLEANVMGRPYIYNDCLVISKNNLTTRIDNDMEYWDFDNYIYIDLK